MQEQPTFDPRLPHWEWRTFGLDFGEAGAALVALDRGRAVESDEIYLLSPADDVGVKVRAGLLEIKELEAVDAAGLEQWRLATRRSFPLPHSAVGEVCTALDVAPPSPGKDVYSLDEFLAALAGGGVRAVAVRKTRRRYVVNECMAEITQVTRERETVLTLAIEAVDPSRVAATVRLLGLSGRANTSYPRWLRAVTSKESASHASRGVPR